MKLPRSSNQSKHVPVLDHLRGLAALLVCLFHFSTGNIEFLPDGDPIKQLGSLGWLGVEAFFVISGFVIPYSLYLKSYRYRDAFDFLTRRLKRLEPPYFACILLILALNYLSSLAPGFHGAAHPLIWSQLLAHLGYLNAVLNLGWLNPTFWTLAIEFQYYIFMASIFPLLAHPKSSVRTVTVIVIALLGIVGFHNTALLPHWLPIFAIGMITFQAYVGKLPVKGYAILLTVIAAVSLFTVGILQTFIGVCTALIILTVENVPSILSPLAFFGTISYSLYLLHAPIGGRIINLATRLPDSVLFRYPAIIVAFAVSIACSFIFWWYIERTSQAWAKSSQRVNQQSTEKRRFLPFNFMVKEMK